MLVKGKPSVIMITVMIKKNIWGNGTKYLKWWYFYFATKNKSKAFLCSLLAHKNTNYAWIWWCQPTMKTALLPDNSNWQPAVSFKLGNNFFFAKNRFAMFIGGIWNIKECFCKYTWFFSPSVHLFPFISYRMSLIVESSFAFLLLHNLF